MSTLLRLDSRSLERATDALTETDAGLASVVAAHGLPPLWAREPVFSTLVQIILEQQVSLKSGAAAYRRVEQAVESITAESIRSFGSDGLQRVGITRQKTFYLTAAAEAIMNGELKLECLGSASDAEARQELLRLRGVGPWTADVYLLMALLRPDVWPNGDIALLTAMQNLRGWSNRPTVEEARKEAVSWRPWRAVAARILWHGYMQGSLRSP